MLSNTLPTCLHGILAFLTSHAQTDSYSLRGGSESIPTSPVLSAGLAAQKGTEQALPGWRRNSMEGCLPISIFQAFACPQSSSEYLHVQHLRLGATGTCMPLPHPRPYNGLPVLLGAGGRQRLAAVTALIWNHL